MAFIFKFPDFSLTFQILSKFPWPSTKFPDLEKISFSRYFSLTVATLIVCTMQMWSKSLSQNYEVFVGNFSVKIQAVWNKW